MTFAVDRLNEQHRSIGNSKRVHEAIDTIAIPTVQYAISMHWRWSNVKCFEPGGQCTHDNVDVCALESLLRWLRMTIAEGRS